MSVMYDLPSDLFPQVQMDNFPPNEVQTAAIPSSPPRPSANQPPGHTSSSLSDHRPIAVTFAFDHASGQGPYPVTSSIQYVLDCLSGLLQTENGQNLFVPSLLRDPQHWSRLDRSCLAETRWELRALLHNTTIGVNAATTSAAAQFGTTSTTWGRHRLKINRDLLDAVADCPEIDTANAHLFAALLSACGHELMHCIHKRFGLDSAPSTPTSSSPRCGGAGYVWEELLWGGVFAFVQENSPGVSRAESEGCGTEPRESWTAEEDTSKRKQGPPTKTTAIHGDKLDIVRRSMDQMQQGSKDLSFPLFEPGELPELSTYFSGHRAFRTSEGNIYCAPLLRRTTVRIGEGDNYKIICSSGNGYNS